jgi:hypothetical protein
VVKKKKKEESEKEPWRRKGRKKEISGATTVRPERPLRAPHVIESSVTAEHAHRLNQTKKISTK